jgi:hypothetical protein
LALPTDTTQITTLVFSKKIGYTHTMKWSKVPPVTSECFPTDKKYYDPSPDMGMPAHLCGYQQKNPAFRKQVAVAKATLPPHMRGYSHTPKEAKVYVRK